MLDTVGQQGREIADPSWFQLDQADGELNNARVLIGLVYEAAQYRFSDPVDSKRAQEQIIVLTEAIEHRIKQARAIVQTTTEALKQAV